MTKISILSSTCIRCRRCVKICPTVIFFDSEQDSVISTQHTNTCIKCGHCVAICPTSSVVHQNFPPHKIHAIDTLLLPTPEQVMTLCRSRRSTRVFTQESIAAEKLTQIIEAAHRAPTGTNLQEVQFTLITSCDTLKLVSHFTLNTFVGMRRKLLNPLLKPFLKAAKPHYYRYVPLIDKMKREMEKGNDMILRNGTALLLLHAPQSATMGVIDCNLAYQNGSLMAESLGVGQFYAGFVLHAVERNKGKLEKLLGIKGRICAAMVLGIPQFKFIHYVDKKEAVVSSL